MIERRIAIVGANGQLGKALQVQYPEAVALTRTELDVTSPSLNHDHDWSHYDTVINAAAYTKVDNCETDPGRKDAWLANATAVGGLARVAREFRLKLVHISSDYVFDGAETEHHEDEPLAPLSTYGATKAAGDIAASIAPNHYILRTSWLIGEGNNFVRTMVKLAETGVNPSVVNDQIGRLTFTEELCRGIHHLLSRQAAYGTYNLTNSGSPVSWEEIAKEVYRLRGYDPARVSGISTEEHFASKSVVATRPLQSTLTLDKIVATGFEPHDWQHDLEIYLREER